jgi:enterochelin esterase-like enzyme
MMGSGHRNLEAPPPGLDGEGVPSITVETRPLGGRADVAVFVPSGAPAETPLVLLLPGVFGSHRAWAQQGGAPRTAQRLIDEGRIRPMVIAMPPDGLWLADTGYVPHAGGGYERWIMQDVVHGVSHAVPTLGPAVLLAGFSMGGYAALRLGAKYGGVVRAVSVHSPVTRMSDTGRFVAEPNSSLAEEPFLGVWIARYRATLPPMRFDCGTDDPLIDASRGLHEELVRQQVPHRYQEFPGGHDWAYWSAHLADTLLFFEETLRAAAAPSAPRGSRRSSG